VPAPTLPPEKPVIASGRKPPVKNRERFYSSECPLGAILTTTRDIQQMRQQINAFKRSLVWIEEPSYVSSEMIAGAVETPNNEVLQTLMITDLRPIDIRRPPQAAQLISMTGIHVLLTTSEDTYREWESAVFPNRSSIHFDCA
jgi:hypothetical protein